MIENQTRIPLLSDTDQDDTVTTCGTEAIRERPQHQIR